MPTFAYKGQLVVVADSEQALVDYYVGDGAAVVGGQDVEQLPDGQAFLVDGTERTFEPGQPVPDATGQVVDVATGEPADEAAPQPGVEPDPAGD